MALAKHLRRRAQGIKSLYDTELKPDPNLESQIQLLQRYQSSHIERSLSNSSRPKKGEKLAGAGGGGAGKEQRQPLIKSNSNDSEDFVTISYGSDSVSFTKKTSVNPLKRCKVRGKRSLEDYANTSSLATPTRADSVRRGIFDPLPPLPPRKNSVEKAPPIPPKPFDVEVSLPPVPIRKGVGVPIPPPRKGGQPPEPPPRSSRKQKDEAQVPPSPPPRTKKNEVPESSVKVDSSPVGVSNSMGVNSAVGVVSDPSGDVNSEGQLGREDGLSSPGVYGTPQASFDTYIKEEFAASVQREEELQSSDHSEGYRTPPPASPLPNTKELLSISGSSGGGLSSQSHQSFFTPLGTSSREDSSSRGDLSSSHVSETSKMNGETHSYSNKEKRVGTYTENSNENTNPVTSSHLEHVVARERERKKDVTGKTLPPEENHYEFEQSSSLANVLHDKKISVNSMASEASDCSLVITKAVSEVWSNGSTPETDRQEQSHFTDEHPPPLPRMDTGEESVSHSPIIELMESTSEGGEDDISMLQGDQFHPNTIIQSRGENWSTLISPTRSRTEMVSY